MKKQAKTTGLEWLYLSMASFNGSGYAIKHTPETYLDSYVAYKKWKKKKDSAVELVEGNREQAMFFAERLYKANPSGHVPKEKNIIKFMDYYIKGYAK
jgi:hypothetical protein